MTELAPFIIHCLSKYYRIEPDRLALISLGADVNAWVYKVESRDQKNYFVKLRRGHFKDAHMAILELLGIQQLIRPIKTVTGEQMQQVGEYTLIVYPFVQGVDGFSCPLTAEQWIALGRAMRQIHALDVPSSLAAQIRREEFSPKWRDVVRSIYSLEPVFTDDPIALNLWTFLQDKRSLILHLVDRSWQLSAKARFRPHNFVLCHSDIHAGNVLVDGKEDLYIVDWDDPILAPKERDLMFIGGGVGNVWNKPGEESLFYQGYGQADLDWPLLAYYRYERIAEDIAVYCQELLVKPSGDNNRLEMYQHFMNQFDPQGVVEIAIATDKNHLAT